jgi:N-acetylmuramoyl-L-alanine amidase
MTKNRITRSSLPVLVTLLAAAVALSAAPLPPAGANLAAARRQYQRAQKLEKSLEKKLGGTRTETEYLNVIKAYRRVALLTPSASLVTPSLFEVAKLYEQMGHLFRREYFQKSVDSYQHLLREYPRTRYGPEAVFSIARLEQGPLGNPALARKFLRTLIKKYPSSDQADAARLELAENAPSHHETAREAKKSAGSDLKPAPTTDKSEPAAGATLQPVSENLTGGSRPSRPTRVRSAVSEQTGGETRIVIALDGPVKFDSSFIPRPRRVFFDLSSAYLAHPHGMTLDLHSRYVGKVRVAQNRRHIVRVVLDVARGAGYSASLLPHPYRLVISVGKAGAASAPTGSLNAAANPANQMPAKGNLTPARPLRYSPTTSLTRALGLKIYRIVIDPGHGGFDTGTIGPNGLEEKTICLDIAKRLGSLIEKRLPGTEVIYTRDSDVFVPLEQRTRIANEKKADLFISIHANSSPDQDARGVEAYYLNFTTSPRALAVAARENALAQEPVHKLQNLLQKISLNDKIGESREFAADVDHSLVHELHVAHVQIRDRGVKKAPFVVLIGAHMPSILVEVSFLSNPTDDHLLGRSSYRQRIALGLFDGVRRYISSLNSLASSAATDQAANNHR